MPERAAAFKHGAPPFARVPRAIIPFSLVSILLVAGCSSPATTGDVTPSTPGSQVPTSDPFATTPGGGGSTTTPTGATGGTTTPSSPSPPQATPGGEPYTGFWEHDHGQAPRVYHTIVAPGSGPTDFLVGFQPVFAAGRFRCDGPEATIVVTAPDGTEIVSVRAGDRPTEGGGCPAPIRIPRVNFVGGEWKVAFAGTGDIAGYVATGKRATPSNVTWSHTNTHDHTFPENYTFFSVPDFATAVDVTIRLVARDPGDPCPADSVRVILRDPRDQIFERIDLPSTPPISECTRTRVAHDVVLAPGRWTIQWGGSGEIVSSVTIAPRA